MNENDTIETKTVEIDIIMWIRQKTANNQTTITNTWIDEWFCWDRYRHIFHWTSLTECFSLKCEYGEMWDVDNELVKQNYNIIEMILARAFQPILSFIESNMIID